MYFRSAIKWDLEGCILKSRAGFGVRFTEVVLVLRTPSKSVFILGAHAGTRENNHTELVYLCSFLVRAGNI